MNKKIPPMSTQSAFLKSLEPNLYPSLTPTSPSAEQLDSITLSAASGDCVHLFNDQETLLIKSEQDFVKCLKIEANHKVKVVAIFGNTGEGKSFTLNHTFFAGKEVFRTSPSQSSCTLGVWAKFEPKLGIICLDTEGLLGISKNEHIRTRLLLKILAVSDIIIYRTKAERLPRDIYTFLGGASKAFTNHFGPALKTILKKYVDEKLPVSLGPAVIIFHETRYSDTLNTSADLTKSPEEILRENFTKLELNYDGFSSLKYIGLKNNREATSFEELKIAIEKELESTEVRSARDPKYIFYMLKALNDKFQSQISASAPQMYLPAFFTCQEKCLSCEANCCLSMGHKDDGEPHENRNHCKLQHQYQNFVYLCKACKNNGSRQVVEPSYQTKNEQLWNIFSTVWSGYVIECPTCGIIYRSREYWYGNKDPKDEAVLVEIVHVWAGEKSLFGSQNSAQKVLDGVTSITNVVASVGSQPTKMLTDWVTDQIAPSYWRPNNEITECHKCKYKFLSNVSKHHCRACGEGFCERCSSRSQPVPSRGWFENVRVCDLCYREEPPSMNHVVDGAEVRTRRIGETVLNSFSAVKSVLEIPKEMIKETARPAYWTPDNECINCAVCNEEFGVLLGLHHCRECGKGVCDTCSKARKPVPLRGWDKPVRVCNDCV